MARTAANTRLRAAPPATGGAAPPQYLAFRAGWNDVRAKRPPDPAFADHPDMGIALSYESGRLNAANVKAARLRLREAPARAVSGEIMADARAAAAAIGRSVPPDLDHRRLAPRARVIWFGRLGHIERKSAPTPPTTNR